MNKMHLHYFEYVNYVIFRTEYYAFFLFFEEGASSKSFYFWLTEHKTGRSPQGDDGPVPLLFVLWPFIFSALNVFHFKAIRHLPISQLQSMVNKYMDYLLTPQPHGPLNRKNVLNVCSLIGHSCLTYGFSNGLWLDVLRAFLESQLSLLEKPCLYSS